MKKIPTTKEQVLASWEVTKQAAKRLSDAKAKLELLPDEPDITLLQSEIDIFRAAHAEQANRREAEMRVFRAEHAEIKRRREAEFLAAQRIAKAIADSGEEVKRAKKAFDIATRNQEKIEKNYTA